MSKKMTRLIALFVLVLWCVIWIPTPEDRIIGLRPIQISSGGVAYVPMVKYPLFPEYTNAYQIQHALVFAPTWAMQFLLLFTLAGPGFSRVFFKKITAPLSIILFFWVLYFSLYTPRYLAYWADLETYDFLFLPFPIASVIIDILWLKWPPPDEQKE